MNTSTVRGIVNHNLWGNYGGIKFLKDTAPIPNQYRRETWQELVNQNRGTTINSANGRGNPLYSPNPTHVTVGAPITKSKIYQDKHKESTNKQNNKKLVSKQSTTKSAQKKVPSKTVSDSFVVKNGYHTFKYKNGSFYRMNAKGELGNKPIDIYKLDSQFEKNLLYQKLREFSQSKTPKKPSSTSTNSKTTSIPVNLPSGNNKNTSGQKEKTPTATTKSVSTNKVRTTNTPQTKSIETTSTTVQSTAAPTNRAKNSIKTTAAMATPQIKNVETTSSPIPTNSIKVQNTGNKRPVINWNNRAKSILGEDLNGDGVIDSKDVSWLQNQYNQNKSSWNNAGYQTISDGNYSIDGKIGNTTKNLWEWYKQNRAKVFQTADTTPVKVETSQPVYEDYVPNEFDDQVPNGYRTIVYGNRSYSVPDYTTTDTPIDVQPDITSGLFISNAK